MLIKCNVVIQFGILLLCFKLAESNLNHSGFFRIDDPCIYDFDCENSEICEENICVCKPDYKPFGNHCVPCSDDLKRCTLCCINKDYECEDGICKYQWNIGKLTLWLVKIVVMFALMVATIILLTVLIKLCIASYRNRNSTFRSSISSANSVQLLVNERMRHRPPSYQEVYGLARLSAVDLYKNYGAEAPPAYSSVVSTIQIEFTEPTEAVSQSEPRNVDNPNVQLETINSSTEQAERCNVPESQTEVLNIEHSEIINTPTTLQFQNTTSIEENNTTVQSETRNSTNE